RLEAVLPARHVEPEQLARRERDHGLDEETALGEVRGLQLQHLTGGVARQPDRRVERDPAESARASRLDRGKIQLHRPRECAHETPSGNRRRLLRRHARALDLEMGRVLLPIWLTAAAALYGVLPCRLDPTCTKVKPGRPPKHAIPTATAAPTTAPPLSDADVD